MQPNNLNNNILDLERFSRTLAELVILSLTTYVAILRELSKASEAEPTPQQLEIMHTAGRNLGLELLAFVQVAKHAGNSQTFVESQHDPSPITALANELGMSYSMLLRVKDKASAAETPVSPIPAIQSLYNQLARAWLLQYSSVIPEFIEK